MSDSAPSGRADYQAWVEKPAPLRALPWCCSATTVQFSNAIFEAAYRGGAKFPCLCQSLGEERGLLLTVSQIQLCT